MLATMRKCLVMLPPQHRRRWLCLVPLAIVTGVAEIGAASAIFVLLRLMTSPAETLATPWVAGIVAYLPGRNQDALIPQIAGLLATYYVAKSALIFAAQYLRHRVAHGSSAYLASEMLRRYLSAPYPFHLRRNSAELIRNCTSSVGEVLGGVLGATVSMVGDLLMSAGLLYVLVSTSPRLSIVAGAVIILLMVAVLRLTKRAAGYMGSELHELNASTIQGLQQALGGIKELKVLGREQYFYEEFVDLQHRRRLLGDIGVTLGSLASLVVQTILVCGALALVAVLALLGVSGIAAVPIAGVFGYAGARILPMANSIVITINGLRANRKAVDDLFEDFVSLSPAPVAAAADARHVEFKDAIVLDRVSYTYPLAESAALSDVSLVIRRGESIGIVGPTGAGKSTLVDLILGLLPPREGRILIDGADLSRAHGPWKRRVGYVPQAVFLIDDTLRRNIALGIRDADIDERRVRTAMAMAQLEPFVGELPSGLDTRVGERGVRLSGGERQRVAMARALYHDPDLIVFDEATASLDVVTESEVTRAIENLRGVKTMIVIAHRLSAVKHCDRLVWLRMGRVAGLGSFDELRRGSAEFRELAALASA
jgi:ATP-binding cassette subfamily C protein